MNLFYDRKQMQITNSICDYNNGNLFPKFPEAVCRILSIRPVVLLFMQSAVAITDFFSIARPSSRE